MSPRFAVAVGMMVVICAIAGRALGAPTLIGTRATAVQAAAGYEAFVGGIDDSGRPLKLSEVQIISAGTLEGLVSFEQPFSDWAAAAAEKNSTWRPPLAVGLVYLWVKDIPRGVLDGIHAFFQRVPSRTTVLPTVYGRMRQGRASLIAADISRLDEEVPPLEDYRPNMIEAVRMDLGDLGANPSSIKVLLLVTDGRDFADPKGQRPGDFSALGKEIKKAGVTLLVVGYPPSSDPLQSAENLRQLHDAAGGFLRILEQPEELENTLESLGQAIGDLRHVQFSVPWTWRAFGASRRVSFRLTTTTGQRLTTDAGMLEVSPSSWLVVVASLFIFGVLSFIGLLLFRRRGAPAGPGRGRGGDDEDEDVEAEAADRDTLLIAVHALIRRGTAPERVVEELTRNFSGTIDGLLDLAPAVFTDPRFPYFRTRPGRQRLQEIRDLIARKSTSAALLGPVVIQVLVAAMSDGMPADAAAQAISARSGSQESTSFSGMGLKKLAEALRTASREHPMLATPKARGIAVAIQDALRTRGTERSGTVIGWLVRAAGPGRRGETLRLKGGQTILGRAESSHIRLQESPGVHPEHAEIVAEGDEFALASRGGPVMVEGIPVTQPHVLVDGETIQVADNMFVFKVAAVGNLLPNTLAGMRSNFRGREA